MLTNQTNSLILHFKGVHIIQILYYSFYHTYAMYSVGLKCQFAYRITKFL